jgi:hypothetical protein
VTGARGTGVRHGPRPAQRGRLPAHRAPASSSWQHRRRTYQLLLTRLREVDLTGPRPAIRQAAADLLGETGAQRGTTAPASARHGW